MSPPPAHTLTLEGLVAGLVYSRALKEQALKKRFIYLSLLFQCCSSSLVFSWSSVLCALDHVITGYVALFLMGVLV